MINLIEWKPSSKMKMTKRRPPTVGRQKVHQSEFKSLPDYLVQLFHSKQSALVYLFPRITSCGKSLFILFASARTSQPTTVKVLGNGTV